jgi:cytochrome c peroxidase
MYEGLFGALPDLSDSKRFPENAAPVSDPVSESKWHEMSEIDRKTITRVYANMGKAIAAYERLLMPGPSRFDEYVEAVLEGRSTEKELLTTDEVAGLKLFIGKAMCVTCHMGPLFTNHSFHNVGAPDAATKKPKYMLPVFYLFKDKPPVDLGRFNGIQQALKSEFNCLGEYSDAADEDCAELKFANTNHTGTLGAFKVPTLRNIAETAPYMHVGQFENLGDIVKHYNAAPGAPSGHSELMPLNLKATELLQIEAFLRSLSGSPDVATELLQSPDMKPK